MISSFLVLTPVRWQSYVGMSTFKACSGFHDFPTLDGCRSWTWRLLFQTGTFFSWGDDVMDMCWLIVWLSCWRFSTSTCCFPIAKALAFAGDFQISAVFSSAIPGISWLWWFYGFIFFPLELGDVYVCIYIYTYIYICNICIYIYIHIHGYMIPGKNQPFFAASDSNKPSMNMEDLPI